MTDLPHVADGDPHAPAHNAERDAINDLSDRIDTKISLPPGAATGDLLRWDGVEWLTTETRFLEGDGPPDGVVSAPVGSRYIDKTGAQGAVEWVKRSGGVGNTGWICIAGDTGLRNIAGLIDKGNGTIWNATLSRVGQTVDIHIDATMPSNKTATWKMLGALPGFGPGYARYAALQDNNELASSGGSLVTAIGEMYLYGVVGAKRDRFTGTWSTHDAWPEILPGVPV